MNKLEIMAAKEEDAAIIAKLLYNTEKYPQDEWGGGNKEDIVQRVADLVRNTDNRYSYKHATVAKVNGEVCGVLMAYSYDELDKLTRKSTKLLMKNLHGLKPKLKLLYGWIVDSVYNGFYSECYDGEYYISNISTDEKFRGLGIGQILMEEAERVAKEKNLETLSLIAINKNVCRYYKKFHYSIAAKYGEEEDISFRMVKSL